VFGGARQPPDHAIQQPDLHVMPVHQLPRRRSASASVSASSGLYDATRLSPSIK